MTKYRVDWLMKTRVEIGMLKEVKSACQGFEY